MRLSALTWLAGDYPLTEPLTFRIRPRHTTGRLVSESLSADYLQAIRRRSMRSISLVWIAGLLVASVAAAGGFAHSSQRSLDSPPQSAELKVLDAWRGTWTTEGKWYGTPYSHAGEITITMTCGWSSYGGYMICDHLINGPAGKRNDLSVYTYNPVDKSYKFCGIDRSG